MTRFLLLTGLVMGVALGVAPPADRMPEQPQAVLVELFTSEGCSSCPPADALLERLDRSQPIPGAQMVVDGRSEFVGSDARAAESAIRSATKRPKAAIRITEDGGSAIIDVGSLPAGTARKAAVFAAYAADSGTQDVLRGENKGRKLHHVAIVKELKQIGTVDEQAAFTTRIHLEPGARLVVFIQEFGNGPVLGTVMRPASQ